MSQDLVDVEDALEWCVTRRCAQVIAAWRSAGDLASALEMGFTPLPRLARAFSPMVATVKHTGTALGTVLGVLGSIWVTDILAAVLLCFLASLYPARRAAQLPPAEALRHD